MYWPLPTVSVSWLVQPPQTWSTAVSPRLGTGLAPPASLTRANSRLTSSALGCRFNEMLEAAPSAWWRQPHHGRSPESGTLDVTVRLRIWEAIAGGYRSHIGKSSCA